MQFKNEMAASRIVLEDGTVLTKCDQCRAMHAERIPPTTPPCETCWIELNDENQEPALIYMMTRGQVVTLGERTIDISIPAIKIAMDLYKIKNQKDCMEKVMNLFHHFESERRKNES